MTAGVLGLIAHRRLDYFSQSPFWDHQSNNGTLRTQFRLNPEFNYDREIQWVLFSSVLAECSD